MMNILNISIKFSTMLLTFATFIACGSHKKIVINVDVIRFDEILQNENVQLLDVRTESEYKEGHIKGAQNIDVLQTTFASIATHTLDKKKPVAVYCRSGKRSAQATEVLKSAGFKTYNLLGGFLEWKSNSKSIVQ